MSLNSATGCRHWTESHERLRTIRPQGARAKARSSPPARFTSPAERGKSQQQNQKTTYTDFFTKPWMLIVSCVVCLLLSIVVARRKLPLIDRIFPFIWQIILFAHFLFSFTHGFPSEEFRGMIFASIWSVLAWISSYRLYRISMTAVRVFAFFQFIQSLCILFLAVLGYISACWRYYGQIIWNP